MLAEERWIVMVDGRVFCQCFERTCWRRLFFESMVN